jgi:hypothetical protein
VEFPLNQHHDWVFPLLLETWEKLRTHDFIMVCLKFRWSLVCTHCVYTHCGWWSQCGVMTACHSHSGIMKLVVPTVSDCHEVMTGLILVMLLLVLLELTECLTFQVLLWSFVWNLLDMFLSGSRECSASK